MSIDSATLRRLEHDAAKLGDRNHVGYLAEVMHALSVPGAEPTEALRLLRAMWGTAYASREWQKQALNDVGRWLEREIQDGVDAATLRQKVGWLKRLSGTGPQNAHSDSRSDRCIFGDRLTQAKPQRPPKPTSPKRQVAKTPEVSVQPEVTRPLPDELVVQFTDFIAARAAYQSYKKRVDAGKAPKPKVLPLTPANPEFARAAKMLSCSTTETAGFAAVFRVIEASGGRAKPIRASDFVERDGKLIAGRMAPVG